MGIHIRSRNYLLVALLLLMTSGCNTSTRSPVDVDNDGTYDGDGLDLNGDGKIDAVDTDGDGDADGMDIDGDGYITIWARLGRGLEPPTAEQTMGFPVHIDPDLFKDLDPQNPPLAVVDGEVPLALSPDVSQNITPLNQGNHKSCTAFAVAATATLVRARREGRSPNNLWASPAFLYDRARKYHEPPITCEMGVWLHDALNTLVREDSATRNKEVNLEELCENIPQASEGHQFRIGSWAHMLPFSRAMVRKELLAGRMVPFGVYIPQNFHDWNRGKSDFTDVFKSNDNPCAEKECGNHAMLIVGFDDAKNAYRILNSWGPDWGDKGYVWWDYDDFERRPLLEAYTITVDPNPQPFPAPNADTFEMEVLVKMGKQQVSSYQKRKGGPWYLGVGVHANEPLMITKYYISAAGVPKEEKSAWFSHGNLEFEAGTQAAVGKATVRIEGTLRNGLWVTKELDVTVPQPTATKE